MVNKKIHIIGGSGSGKTYCAKKLSRYLGIKQYDLDTIFWDQSQSEYVRASEEQRDSELETIILAESWIIEGVYYKWLSKSFSEADKIIVLTTPLWLRQLRVVRRYLAYKFNRNHKKDETLSNLVEMMQWNNRYDGRYLVPFYSFVSEHEHKVYECRSYKEVEEVVNA